MKTDGIFFSNLYSQQEVTAIFNACDSWEECDKVVKEFHWLIQNEWQMRDPHLYYISTVTFNKLIKKQ